MLVLFETPAGFALFKVLDEGKLDKVEDLWKEFETGESARKVVKLKAFSKFENTAEALGAATLLVESKPSKSLRKFLKAECQGELLAVADSKLGNSIKEKLQIDCIHNNAVMEVMRGLRSQLSELISGLAGHDLGPMSLGLSHSLSRYKLKFSPEKVDTMIIQAIGLLDDLDKELNTYAMRVREWYGWHFPELGKIVQDNILYAKAVKAMGHRTNAVNMDFSGILAEEVEVELKEAANISMGTDISDQDMLNIKALCDQVISLSEYRGQLSEYLRSRMNAIAPNLTVLVGELVGARLIAHAGSLINLAKQPGSTVQILGAEKALFRALKTKHATPKYGLIFNASLVGQAAPKLKGKISRSLAAKSALSVRYDALGDAQDATIGFECKAKLENRLRQLEGRMLGKLSGSAKGKGKIEPYDSTRKQGTPGLVTAAKTYNPAADVVGLATPKTEEADGKQKKRKREVAAAEEARADAEAEAEVVREPVTGKSEKKRKREEPVVVEVKAEPEVAAEEEPKKKKKKKHQEQQLVEPKEEPQEPAEENAAAGESAKKKKKKSKNVEQAEDPEEIEQGDSSKKKKSKTVVLSDDPTGTDDGGSSKKKKSKAVEPVEDPSGIDNGGSIKKKKKKKHSEESS